MDFQDVDMLTSTSLLGMPKNATTSGPLHIIYFVGCLAVGPTVPRSWGPATEITTHSTI